MIPPDNEVMIVSQDDPDKAIAWVEWPVGVLDYDQANRELFEELDRLDAAERDCGDNVEKVKEILKMGMANVLARHPEWRPQ